MKRLYITLVLLAVWQSNNLLAAKSEKDQLLDELSTAQKRAFVRSAFTKENLIVSRLTPEDAAPWNQIISKIGVFVNKNAPELNRYFKDLRNLSDTLQNTLKTIFNGYIAPALKSIPDKQEGIVRIDKNRLDFDKIRQNMNAIEINVKLLEKRLAQNINMEEELEQKFKEFRSQTFTSKYKGDAAAVLVRLLLVLKNVINRVTEDFDKLQVAVRK